MMGDWKKIVSQYKVQHEKDTNAIAAITIELIKLRQMRNSLSDIINDGNAPSLGELKPSTNLTDDYYQRLAEIITNS